MITKEEPKNVLNSESAAFNNKPKELNEDELEKVTGGNDDDYCMYRSECQKGQDCKHPSWKGNSCCKPM